MNGIPDHAKTWTTKHDERANWPDGEWQHEPDKASWTDEATGRPCLIVRNPVGALCGYVAVDPGHPLHGAGYSGSWDDEAPAPIDVWEREHGEIRIHGGLTFAAGCEHGDDESTGICHVPAAGEPDDVWWFGFDCAHSGDEVPSMLAYGTGFGGTYKSVGYVARECESLAQALTANERVA